MDVLHPPLEEIDSSMYRINPHEYRGWRSRYQQEDKTASANKDYEENLDKVDSILSDIPIMEEIPNARGYFGHQLRIQFHVPKALLGFVIGTKGQTRQRLESETRTKILIPKRDEEGDVVVTGSKEENIKQSYLKIKMLVSSSRNKLRSTHFISIPLNTPDIRERFNTFKNQVLECDGGEQEVLKNELLFNIPGRLHLTLSMLMLLDERERELACRRLDECQENVIESLLKNRAIAVRVRGIDFMDDDPTRVKVLYAKVESADKSLQNLTNAVSSFFKLDGLTKDQCNRDGVNFHVTLMNTKFLNSRSRQNEILTDPPKRYINVNFDATKILKNFRDFDFGVVMVNSLHISQFGTYSEEGYYLPLNKIEWN